MAVLNSPAQAPAPGMGATRPAADRSQRHWAASAECDVVRRAVELRESTKPKHSRRNGSVVAQRSHQSASSSLFSAPDIQVSLSHSWDRRTAHQIPGPAITPLLPARLPHQTIGCRPHQREEHREPALRSSGHRHQRSGQQRPQVDLAGRGGAQLRAARLGDGAHLRAGAAAARTLRQRRRCGADDGRRHLCWQGRLPKSRPDGLRQPLRHGVLLRAGLHRLDADPPRSPDRGAHRAGAVRQAVRRTVARSAGGGPHRDARTVAAGRSDADDGQRARRPGRRHRHAARRVSQRNWRRPTSNPDGPPPTA